MNTDNFSILSQTIDYGPFQFLDAYDPTYICNHSDEMGRYSFMEQPSVGLWNLVRLATAMAPLIEKEVAAEATQGKTPHNVSEEIKPILDKYVSSLRDTYQALMCNKFGFSSPSALLMQDIVEPMMVLMDEAKMDYNLFLRALSNTSVINTDQGHLSPSVWEQWKACSYASADELSKPDLELHGTSFETRFHVWYITWRNALLDQGNRQIEISSLMLSKNPKYTLRNHIAQLVIEKYEAGDRGVVDRYLQVLSNPYVDAPPALDDEFRSSLVPYSMRSIKCSCSS
jgi:uncharacterized protein YdiU (UPF0061 family)